MLVVDDSALACKILINGLSKDPGDVLFHSVARHVGSNAAAVVLTDMGNDGAEGLLAIRQVGGRTLAQYERTSVVFGMPCAAWEKSAAEMQVPLESSDTPAKGIEIIRRNAHGGNRQ